MGIMGGEGSGRPKGTSSTSKYIKEILSDGRPHHGYEIYKYVKERAKDAWYAKNPTYSSVIQLLRVMRYIGLVRRLTEEEVNRLGLDTTPDISHKGGNTERLHKRTYFVIVEDKRGDKAWNNPQGWLYGAGV
ncbi:MAG: hypothetical protein N2V75_00165 [Methanophagales archaeon]|nr:hypothetical protein [Methanophagales archaeon]